MKYTTVGVEIAKNVFQLHWVDADTGEIVNKQLKRAVFLEHFASREPCLVGMDACGSAQHWARRLIEVGPRFCSHSHEQSKGTGKRSESEIVPRQLVVTSGDTTKMFDTTEKAFDDVPGPIQHAAIATLGLSIRTR